MPIIKIELTNDEKIALKQLLDAKLKSFIGLPNTEENVNNFKSAVGEILMEFVKPLSTVLVNNLMDDYEKLIRQEISDYFIYGAENKV